MLYFLPFLIYSLHEVIFMRILFSKLPFSVVFILFCVGFFTVILYFIPLAIRVIVDVLTYLTGIELSSNIIFMFYYAILILTPLSFAVVNGFKKLKSNNKL
jgi:hypothetical protein